MAAHLVATVRITDPERFGKYLEGIKGLSARFGGELVTGGQVSEVLEGDAPADLRVLVTRYPDGDAARAYLNSPEYQAAKPHRIGAAEANILLLED